MYYKDPNNNSVYFYESLASVRAGLVPISDEEAKALITVVDVVTKENNKFAAVQLLKETDWVEFPSVTAPGAIPQLLNASAFRNYRMQLRLLAINPPEGEILWPAKPAAEWKL